MSENRLSALQTEAEAHEVLLQQLAKAHGAESRAADIVAQECLLNRFRYTPALGWLEWDGRRWDTDDEANEKVIEVVRRFIDEKEKHFRAQTVEAETDIEQIVKGVIARADSIPDGMDPADIIAMFGTEAEATAYNDAVTRGSEAKRQASMWMNLLSLAKIRSIANLCRAMDGVRTRTNTLDSHPWLLNCTNCVVDLRTGQAQPHDPDLLITKVAGGDYDPAARSKLWDQALGAVHPDILGWFQRRMGQSLTGFAPDDDSLVVSSGGGENGKSGVMNACLKAAGEYGQTISHRVLVSASQNNHPTELMDLRGARLAVMEETPEEGHLDTHQLKTISDGTIKARHMRMNAVEFPVTHSLWINTNFMPTVDTTDHGTWRRLFAMPWPFTFRKPWEGLTETHHRAGDPTLKKKMANDPGTTAAVLAWAVQGAVLAFQEADQGTRPPAAVEDATKEWRLKSDVGMQFAQDYLVQAEGYFISAEELFTEFSTYLAAEGKRAWSKQTVNSRMPASMKAAGIVAQKTPQDKVKINERHTQSHPPNLNGDGWATVRPVDIEPGKSVRVWMGVRFRALAERGQPLRAAM